jgi:hypothetical protein
MGKLIGKRRADTKRNWRQTGSMRYVKLRNETHQFDSHRRLYRIGINLSTLYVFLIIFFSFWGCEKNIPVPQHFIGEWKTSSPQYADRYLKIAEHSLIFGIGDGEELSQDIEKVNVEQENGETIYTIHYKDMEGEKWSLTLIYSPVSGGTFKLKNGKDIWEKVKSESPA